MAVNSPDCTNSEYFCELCSLDFTTQNELEEHTWSMLHNTNLNRKQGRDCVHHCSLCRQEFVGLLEFTGHLHSDSHQERLHNWRRDQHRDWSQERRQHGSPGRGRRSRPHTDWSTDDFSGFVEYFSDHGEGYMHNNWRGGTGPPRNPRDIRSRMDGISPSDYHFHDRRRDPRDEYQERGYPMWNDGDRDQLREFRGSPTPPPEPQYPGMDYSNQENDSYHWRRNSDERHTDRYYEHAGYRYPSDRWRPPYDNNPQFRSRRDSPPHRHGNRSSRRNSNSPHNNSRQKLSSAVAVVSSRKQSEKSPNSRNKDTEWSTESRKKQSPRGKGTQGKSSPGATKRKASKDKTPPKASSSSENPSGKSTRKGTPRKLARPVEEHTDERESTTRKVQVDNNKMEITFVALIKDATESSKTSSAASSVVKARKDSSAVESSNLTNKDNAATKPSLAPHASVNFEASLSAKNDLSSSATKADLSITVEGDILSSRKEDLPSFVETNCSTAYKGNSLREIKPAPSSKEDSLPICERGQTSVTEKDKGGPVTDKNQLTSSFLEKLPKENPIRSLDKKDNPSEHSTEKELNVEHKNTQSFELGGDSSTSLSEKSESTLNSRCSNEPYFTTDKLLTSSSSGDKQRSFGFTQISGSLMMSGSERNKLPGVSVSSQSKQKRHDPTCSAGTISTISSLPWEQREEKLRSLLGIKKEPKDTESQEKSIPRAMAKDDKVTTETEKVAPVPSNSMSSPKTFLGAGFVKGSSPRHVQGFSQLSLSRPQCSFVHIDGVQCGATTWNKYCSYHQRVFKSDEESSQEESVSSVTRHVSKDETRDREASPRSLMNRPAGTKIFKPFSPPNKPSESLGGASVVEEEGSHSCSLSGETNNAKEAKELDDASRGSAKPCHEIDLNSTSYTAVRTTFGAPSGYSDRSISTSSATNTVATDDSSIDLSDTVPRPRRPLGYHDTTVESDAGRPGIDLSDTMPNLEGFLALHSSSTVETKGGSHVDLKVGLTRGRSWNHQRGTKLDPGTAIPSRGHGGHSIDLNETVPQPGRSRPPHFELKEAHQPNSNRQASTSSLTSGVNTAALHPLKQSVKIEPGEERAKVSESQNIGMIDLNFSTRLLGVPHSVVLPFSPGKPPKKPRDLTQSPSDFSNKSSVLSSPQSYGPSPPQSPLFSRRVSSATHLPADQSPSPGSTTSLPSLSLDLSRFNLPPAVRRALAERYSGKKATGTVNDNSVESVDGRRSQPLLSEHKIDGSFEPGKTASSLPSRLRCRGQRSISLDSPMATRDVLHTEESLRSRLFDTGKTFDANQLLGRQLHNEGFQQTSARVSDKISARVTTVSNNAPPLSSTTVPPFSALPRDVHIHAGPPSQENANELQSRGLIDLSSTSYLKRMSVPSVNHGRTADGSRLTSENSRSPARPSVPSRGLIDLNTSVDYGSRDTAMESSETVSVIKRKRLNSLDDYESVSNLGAEIEIKRRKQEENDHENEKPVTYRSGINVQELLSIEREEQNQLQNLHAVQSRLKSVRSQIQKLCTELDSLSSEEQRISLRMGELRNSRLNILENACYQRQVPSQASTSGTQVREKDSKSPSFVSGTCSDNTGPVENVHEKIAGHVNGSSRDVTSNAEKTPLSDCHEVSIDSALVTTEAKHTADSFAHSASENTSGSIQPQQPAAHYSSVETTTKSVSREETRHGRQFGEKVLERLFLASKLVAKETSSTSEMNGKQAYISEQISKTQSGDANADIFGGHGRLGAVSGPSGTGTQVILENPASITCGISDESGVPREAHNKEASLHLNEKMNNDLVKKVQYLYPSEKALFRKRSFSDIHVSKTIEASRKKIQSVRENMKRWKQQEDGIDTRVSSKRKSSKYSGSFPSSSTNDYAENSSELPCKDNQGSSAPKYTVPVKPSRGMTTKELKKSSLFHSGKKDFKGSRKIKAEKLESREGSDQQDTVPFKRRKTDNNSGFDTQHSVLPKAQTSSNGKNNVVSAAAHTTTADLGGSGTEEKDEFPTRDVDSQSKSTSSGVCFRTNRLQVPSSTVKSPQTTTQNPKDKKKQRGSLATKFVGHEGAVCGLKVHNSHLFTCSADKTTRSFSIQTGECVKVYQGHHQAVNCVEVTEDSGRLFTGSNDQTVRSYEIKTGVCTHRFTFDGRVMCLHAAFDLLFVGLNTGIVASIDLVANKLLERLHCHEPRGVSCLTTATEGQRKLLCCGSFDSSITVRDYKTGLLIRTFNHHNMTVLCMQVVNNILYSGSADMNVMAHNLNTGELIQRFHGHTRSVSGLQIVGGVLITSCLDKLIRCYDLTTGELLQVYGGQMDMIFCVLVTDGRIFSGGRDGSIVAAKLDLTVYHPCKWENCELNFGIVSHLKNHLREYHVIEQGAVEACHWSQCGHQFSRDDDIAAVLKHVLGHVVTKTARKSAK